MILQFQPTHPDVNHNLGLIAISADQSEAALPLFKIALDVNPKIEQFWFSYIDALIKNDQSKNAKQAIERAGKRGIDTQRLKALLTHPKVLTEGKNPSQDQLNCLLEYYQAEKY